MKRNRSLWMIKSAVTLALAVGAASAASAQTAIAGNIQQTIRLAAERVAKDTAGAAQATAPTTTPATPAPQTTTQTPAPPTGTPASAPTTTPTTPERPTVQVTLDDVVKLALERNVDIAVQRLNPETFDYSIAALKSAYRPVVGSTLGAQSAVSPSTATISGAAVGSGITAGVGTFSGGVAEALPWGGSQVSAVLNNTRSTTTSTTALFDPQYNPSWAFQVVQPLLRGRTVDSNRQQLVVTKLNQDVSELQVQSTITNTLSSVREAYWNLVYAIQAVEVAKQSVDIAEQLVKDNQVRVTIGIMARIDVVTAQSQAAQQRQALVLAEGTRRTTEIALKRLIVNGTQDSLWNSTIDPVDRPDFRPEPIDVDAAIKKALSSRTDLRIAKKDIQENDATLKYLRNQGQPQADVLARYGLTGLGGTEYIATGSGINRVVNGVIPGGFNDALSSLVQAKYPSWSVSMNVSYPLGTSIVAADVARARIQTDQVTAQTHQIELQIATDVTNAATNVQSSVEAVQAAQAAQDLAQQTYEAEEAKFEVGISTNYNVILTQRDLNTAKNSYLLAVLNYRNALVELDRLQQTTLTTLNVTLVSPTLATGAVGSGCASPSPTGVSPATPCVP